MSWPRPLPAEPRQSWGAFTHEWSQRLAQARRALEQGGPDWGEVLGLEGTGRSTPGLDAAMSRAWAELPGEGPPSPVEPDRWPAPTDAVARTASAHRVLLGERLERRSRGCAVDPVWVLADLAALGDRVRSLEREGWELPAERPDPELSRAWAAWFAGRRWDHRALWEGRYLGLARQALRAVASEVGLPEPRLRRALEDLDSGFFLVLVDDGGGVPPWLDLALMVLERAPGGAVAALAEGLDAAGWVCTRACLRRRGSWPRALRALGTPAGQPDTPAELERLLGAHLGLEVLRGGLQGPGLDVERAWRVARNHRGRLRARLRALHSGGERGRLEQALLAHPALATATQAAMARFWLHHLWQELRRDFTLDGQNLATPPCRTPEPAEVQAVELPSGPLRTWVLLVLLRERGEHLRRWAEEGRTGDHDATWGRLLSQELPAALRGPGVGAAALRPLREHLGLGLNEVIEELLPALEALACTPEDAGVEGLRAALRGVWDEAVPFPQRAYGRMRAQARRVLEGRPPSEEESWLWFAPST